MPNTRLTAPSYAAKCSVRAAHTMAFGKGVNYFPSLSKHGRPALISQVTFACSCVEHVQVSKLQVSGFETESCCIFSSQCAPAPPAPHPIKKQRTVQGSQTQRNVRSSMSDPDMFLNYTPTHSAGPARYSFPEGVHVPEGSAALLLFVNMCCTSSANTHVFT